MSDLCSILFTVEHIETYDWKSRLSALRMTSIWCIPASFGSSSQANFHYFTLTLSSLCVLSVSFRVPLSNATLTLNQTRIKLWSALTTLRTILVLSIGVRFRFHFFYKKILEFFSFFSKFRAFH